MDKKMIAVISELVQIKRALAKKGINVELGELSEILSNAQVEAFLLKNRDKDSGRFYGR